MLLDGNFRDLHKHASSLPRADTRTVVLLDLVTGAIVSARLTPLICDPILSYAAVKSFLTHL